MSERRFDAILLDLDGTLVRSDGRIEARLRSRLHELHAEGVRVMIATGRSEGGTLEVLAELPFDTPALVFNGAGLYCPVEERLLEERLLADRAVSDLIALATREELLPVVVGARRKFAFPPRNRDEEKALRYFHDLEIVAPDEIPTEFVIRVTLFSDSHTDSGALARAVHEHLRRPVYVTDFPLSWLPAHRDSSLLVADIQPPCRGKAEGLRVLEERYGIPAERVVAVGDATNDIPMLEGAGLGVAMGDGMPEARAAADRVIGPNDSDALLELLNELF
ncbi:MAG TPA: HAD family phosphatase [Planctomycetes bacterium]|nr:HAD family phosphatase [Planctomycetota bacterium]